MADVLCLDVWRRVVPRLDLLAATQMQAAVPGVVEDCVTALVQGVLTTPPPPQLADLLHQFAEPTDPARGFQQLTHDACILLVTPHDASMHLSCGGGPVVVARACRSHARIELRLPVGPSGPAGFEALRGSLQALRWTVDAIASRGGRAVEFALAPAPGHWGVLVQAAARFLDVYRHGWPGTCFPTLNRTDSMPSYPSLLSVPT